MRDTMRARGAAVAEALRAAGVAVLWMTAEGRVFAVASEGAGGETAIVVTPVVRGYDVGTSETQGQPDVRVASVHAVLQELGLAE